MGLLLMIFLSFFVNTSESLKIKDCLCCGGDSTLGMSCSETTQFGCYLNADYFSYFVVVKIAGKAVWLFRL